MKDSQFDSVELQTWSLRYASKAEIFYKGDQLDVSKMMLTRLKLLAMLDQIATSAYPLLFEHRIGINVKVIDNLLLPQRIDMEIAYELEKYFRQRNSDSKNPALIEE